MDPSRELVALVVTWVERKHALYLRRGLLALSALEKVARGRKLHIEEPMLLGNRLLATLDSLACFHVATLEKQDPRPYMNGLREHPDRKELLASTH